jgi:prepilin-type N-terminal cleavage/methylation domain-containing protein
MLMPSHHSFRKPYNQIGFTLIELMVTVGIIGILASVTVPSYDKYRRKTLQSEAKFYLSSVYTLEKSFYSEYSAYIPAFDAIGYAPEGFKRYYAYDTCWGCAGSWTGTVTGYSGSSALQLYAPVNVPYTTFWNDLGTCGPYQVGLWSFANDPQVFGPIAYGALYKSSVVNDIWVINQRKELINCQKGF